MTQRLREAYVGKEPEATDQSGSSPPAKQAARFTRNYTLQRAFRMLRLAIKTLAPSAFAK